MIVNFTKALHIIQCPQCRFTHSVVRRHTSARPIQPYFGYTQGLSGLGFEKAQSSGCLGSRAPTSLQCVPLPRVLSKLTDVLECLYTLRCQCRCEWEWIKVWVGTQVFHGDGAPTCKHRERERIYRCNRVSGEQCVKQPARQATIMILCMPTHAPVNVGPVSFVTRCHPFAFPFGLVLSSFLLLAVSSFLFAR